jgi:Holliday junction resolvase
MSFEIEQLIVFAALLGGSLVLALGFTARAAYLAIKAESTRGRIDWTLATVFGTGATVMAAFQLFRVILRF